MINNKKIHRPVDTKFKFYDFQQFIINGIICELRMWWGVWDTKREWRGEIKVLSSANQKKPLKLKDLYTEAELRERVEDGRMVEYRKVFTSKLRIEK